ncbi:hypothetical protein [Sorangium sp. So ce128]|uniref:hypothetical protein n=1 Tax=Sorangium sp. So ce128 TaxID=3133281 RepID=UPI003F5F23BC
MAQYEGNDTFPESAELVNDGTVRDAGSVNVPVEVALDRTTYLRNVGFRRVGWWSAEGSSSSTFSSAHPTYGPNVTDPAANWIVTVTGTRVGDVIQIDLVAAVDVGAVTTIEFKVGVTDDVGVGSEVLAPGRYEASGTTTDTTSNNPILISTYHTVAAAGTTRIRLLGRRSGSGSVIVRDRGGIRAVLLRPSGSSA